jgi:uncharacterized protein YndB with AHSA1/START domain
MNTQTTEAVRRSVRVARAPEEAFRLFTDGIASWWPLESHSLGKDGVPPETVVLEAEVGGRMYERMADGAETHWATVLAWEPPHRVVISWELRPGRPATEVEVRFTPDGDGTLVELEHRGWERLGEQAEQLRSGYASDSGWSAVLGRYAERADGGPR